MQVKDFIKVLFIFILYFVFIPGVNRYYYSYNIIIIYLINNFLFLETNLIIFNKKGIKGGEELGFLR